MATYCITAARPKGAPQHIKAEFKVWKLENNDGEWKWFLKGWKRIGEIADLLNQGHQVRSGLEQATRVATGAAVELELRIARNETDYKISEMPDS